MNQGNHGVSQCEGVQPVSPIFEHTNHHLAGSLPLFGLSTLKRLAYRGAGLEGQNVERYGLHLAVKL